MSPHEHLGYEEQGRGPVLLLIHGFPLNATLWADQLAGLSANRRIIAVDLRGRRKSPGGNQKQYSIDDHADDVIGVLDTLGIARADVGALSMGGYVLFSMWRRHRHRLRSLLLMATKAEADSEDGQRARDQAAQLVLEKGTLALFSGMFPKLVADNCAPHIRARVECMFQDTPAQTAAFDTLAMRNRGDATADLASINVPTLVMHGQEDTLIPATHAKRMAEQIPGAQLAIIPSAGHLLPMEQPVEVNRIAGRFLDEQYALSTR